MKVNGNSIRNEGNKQSSTPRTGGQPGARTAGKASEKIRKVREVREQQRAERARKKRKRAESRIRIGSITYTKSLSHIKHSGSGRYYVRVINRDTREVVREVPPHQELDRISRMRSFLREAYSMKL
jgi:uncharacterized FlaG/YvyC family protein